MRVTLIRHGEAGDDAPRDELRALTLKGRAAVARVGRTLRRRGGDFTLTAAAGNGLTLHYLNGTLSAGDYTVATYSAISGTLQNA